MKVGDRVKIIHIHGRRQDPGMEWTCEPFYEFLGKKATVLEILDDHDHPWKDVLLDIKSPLSGHKHEYTRWDEIDLEIIDEDSNS